MNYYAQGGQAHGLQTIKGHSIQTKDGVPSFGIGGFFQKNVMRPLVGGGTQAIKAVQNIPGIKQISDISTQAVRPIDQALVGLDKSVGKMVPGGWGTVATVAGSMAGVPPIWMAGLGALNGSGVTRKGGNFNLKGAMMGGAMAYGMASLGEYARAANLTPGVDGALEGSMPVNASELGDIVPEVTGPVTSAPTVLPPTIDSTPLPAELANIQSTQPSMFQNAYNAVSAPVEAGIQGIKEAGQAAINPDTYSNALSKGWENVGKTVGGVKDLITDPKLAIAQADKVAGIMAPGKAAAAVAFGGMGLAELDAQADYLKQQQTSGTIDNTEYNTQMALINDAKAKATEAMQASPYQFGNNTATNAADALKQNPYMFAMGGNVSINPPDDQTGLSNQTPMQNFEQGGTASMGGVPGYALGGMAGGRFLSGGGDGVSDDIPAVIGDSQPAKLADGEFVIPARVVSELGNGSSKAGAKQLYAMMDRVQKARGTTVGKGKFAKDSNSEKYLPA